MLAGAVAGACSLGADDDPPRAGTASEQGTPAEGAQARGVRLLRLGRFEEPIYLTAPPEDRRRRFVVEREGRIRVVRGGRTLEQPFLDISDRVSTGGESGLLSMAFAPDYARSGRFYVYYTDEQGSITIDAFRGSGDRADPGSRQSILSVPHHRFNHKGGQLQFGPDGMLYAGFGDGGGGGDPDRNGQDLGELLAKLIRIDPQPGGGYRIPADNPFRGRAGARGEIYAYGLRNPFRFSFDRATGALTIGDVGQDEIEEVSYVPGRAGGRPPRGGYNFGWSVFEGNERYRDGKAPSHVPPVVSHTHDDGWVGVIGGYVLRDRSLPPGLRGLYIYGDLAAEGLRVARLGAKRSRPLGVSVPGLVSFGEDARGRVYAVSLEGDVYRIAAR